MTVARKSNPAMTQRKFLICLLKPASLPLPHRLFGGEPEPGRFGSAEPWNRHLSSRPLQAAWSGQAQLEVPRIMAEDGLISH